MKTLQIVKSKFLNKFNIQEVNIIMIAYCRYLEKKGKVLPLD